MILVDTSVWIDHFRAADPQLAALLGQNQVLAHPCVIGEVALGSVKQRVQVLRHLNNLPAAIVATHNEVLAFNEHQDFVVRRHNEVLVFIERHAIANTGVGYVDACLLASTALSPGAELWSRDKNLRASATRCGLAPRIALT